MRYVKGSALAGRGEELTTWEAYGRLAPWWRDEVANVRLHAATKQRPIDRFQQELPQLRPLPALPLTPKRSFPSSSRRTPGWATWQSLFGPAGPGPQAGHATGQRRRGLDRGRGPGGDAARTLLRAGAVDRLPRTAWRP